MSAMGRPAARRERMVRASWVGTAQEKWCMVIARRGWDLWGGIIIGLFWGEGEGREVGKGRGPHHWRAWQDQAQKER